MHKKDYISNLVNCETYSDVYDLMRNRKFRGLHDTKFEDNNIKVSTRVLSYFNKKINISNDNYILAFRTLLFLKMDGKLRTVPHLSGKQNYFNNLQYILIDIEKEEGNILYFSDILPQTIDEIIYKYRENNTNSLRPLINKLNILKDWILYANASLPIFLQLNPSLLSSSSLYAKLLVDYAAERKAEQVLVGSNKRLYPLAGFKRIIADSILYIENYSEESFLAAEEYYSATKTKKHWDRHAYLYYYLRDSSFSFTEPTLESLQLASRNKSYTENTIKNTKSVHKIATGFEYFTKNMEGACISIILFLTGMRSQELHLLDRHPKITQDEHAQLHRLVYKTSSTEKGDVLVMPIPDIAKRAIEVLSKLSELKDGSKEGRIITSDVNYLDARNFQSRVSNLVSIFCKHIGIKDAPLPHDFRHAMAFLIAFLGEKDGLELARLVLGHKSTMMTLEYMGQFNLLFKEAVEELHSNQSQQLVDKVTDSLKDGNSLYGARGTKLANNINFIGSYAEDMSEALNKSMISLIEKGQLAIIQTPTNICLHDLGSPNEMACQRGLLIEDFINEKPKPSRCVGGDCKNAIFLEEDVEKLIANAAYSGIDSELQKRLMQNTHFVDYGAFSIFDTSNISIVNQYIKNKEYSNGETNKKRII